MATKVRFGNESIKKKTVKFAVQKSSLTEEQKEFLEQREQQRQGLQSQPIHISEIGSNLDDDYNNEDEEVSDIGFSLKSIEQRYENNLMESSQKLAQSHYRPTIDLTGSGYSLPSALKPKYEKKPIITQGKLRKHISAPNYEKEKSESLAQQPAVSSVAIYQLQMAKQEESRNNWIKKQQEENKRQEALYEQFLKQSKK